VRRNVVAVVEQNRESTLKYRSRLKCGGELQPDRHNHQQHGMGIGIGTSDHHHP
jgi:hypothetical protein